MNWPCDPVMFETQPVIVIRCPVSALGAAEVGDPARGGDCCAATVIAPALARAIPNMIVFLMHTLLLCSRCGVQAGRHMHAGRHSRARCGIRGSRIDRYQARQPPRPAMLIVASVNGSPDGIGLRGDGHFSRRCDSMSSCETANRSRHRQGPVRPRQPFPSASRNPVCAGRN
jgi:hypothetical protein